MINTILGLVCSPSNRSVDLFSRNTRCIETETKPINYT